MESSQGTFLIWADSSTLLGGVGWDVLKVDGVNITICGGSLQSKEAEEEERQPKWGLVLLARVTNCHLRTFIFLHVMASSHF